MRRAILSFELPEDKNEYDLCNMAREMRSTLREIDIYLFDQIEHAGLTEDAEAIAEHVRCMINELPLERIE
jgi:hypothetical protein